MLKNYLITAFREIFKNKTFSIIHIFGLSLGIAAFIMILLYSMHELSYDKFYKNSDELYRIRQDRYDKGKLSTVWAAGCAAIGPAVKKEFPEVLSYGRLVRLEGIINIGDNDFREDKLFAANSSYLTLLPVRLLVGVDSTALDEPFAAVISESIARKYYGNINVIGQSFRFNRNIVFRITGVFKDLPENTHFKFNILISWPTFVRFAGPEVETAWQWDGYYTYIRLAKGTDVNAFEKKMNEFTDKQTEADTRQYNQYARFYLQPLKSIHLNSNLMFEAEVNGDSKSVYFLMLIGFIILIIAWVNYINLSTVKAVFRSREVAIRKISGAFRIQLIRQFIIESFGINSIASLIAFIIVVVSMPFFKTFTGREIGLNTPGIWLVFSAVVLVGPIVAGLYPAMIISSFRPMSIFHGKLNGVSGGALLREALVVFQFAASVALIAGTFTVYRQLVYMRNQDLGVDIDQTLVLKGPAVADSTYDQKLTAFKAELLKLPIISAVTASTSVPGIKVQWNAGGIRRVSDDDSESNQYRVIGIDYDFVKAYNLSMVTGRSFSEEYGSDAGSVLFNEEAVKLMGFETPENAIGVDIYFWGNNYKIVGVVKNFHQESLKEPFDALIFRFTPGTRNYFSVKLNYKGTAGSDTYKLTRSTIESIKDNWTHFFPGNPFDYFFLSDQYNNQYHAELQFRTLFGLFSVLAIVIACLGLFGLSWFIIIQRTKEIGIRKVNGATTKNILLLISADYFKLILIGIIIAAPVAWLFSEKWLAKYPDRIAFSWWFFLISGLIILFIAALTIGYNTLAIARTNPAYSLKYE
jgi:putative ABC transport system permease protein